MPEKFIRICPRCKSTDISPDLTLQPFGKGTFFNQYKCNKCGYTGEFFPEVPEKELKKMRKKK